MDILRCLYLKLFFTSLFITSPLGSIDPFSKALLSLKSEFVGDDGSLSDWLEPSGGNPPGEIYACSWSGVKCNHNSTKVEALDLSFKNLRAASLSGNQFSVFTELVDLNLSYNSFSGQLPPGIFNLTNLQSLDISRNNFSDEFPKGVFRLQNLVVLDAFSNSFSGPLPVELPQLQHLKVLNLAGSYFSGPIPSEYGSFKSLEFIHLAGNDLGGNIPPELGKLKTVTHMEIGYNSYQGSIPWQFGNMSELQYLDIAGANISGPIPSEFSNLTKLHSLFLFRNQLTGLIPWEFSRIVPLASLDLSDNQLSGPIPESFAELKNLRLLSLMYNQLNGTIPQGVAKLPSLETLLVWNNLFSGWLPENLGMNSKLQWVDVSTNNFEGSIPPGICSGGSLLKLILFSNKFTGSLEPSISNCSSLVRLRLEDNSFSGKISVTFSHLPEIKYVDLSRNNFTGGIPNDISQAPKLQYFNITDNPLLGGNLPAEIWSSPVLQNFSASSCNISGDLTGFQSCKSISFIELSMNNLEGSIPVSVSNCRALVKMNIANNKLSGTIPDEFADLPSLAELDLSHNNFTGKIPEKLGDSSSLVLLNVSFNDISGSIPSTTMLKAMGTSAYAGNPKLCGIPLHPCADSMTIFHGKGTRKIAWALLLSAAVVVLVLASALGVMYIRREGKDEWKMISFAGLPHFTARDILTSYGATESIKPVSPLSATVWQANLPTGITVSVKRVELEAKTMNVSMEFIVRIGNVRHKNLTRLLGVFHNKHLVYLLYDYFPNGTLTEKISTKIHWATKLKLIIGIARGLCFLHHDCYPAIPHGDLNSSNIVLDENMEPCLAQFGLKYVEEIGCGMFTAILTGKETGEFNGPLKDELCNDIYSFGEIILEILSNGRLTKAGSGTQNKPIEVLLKEMYSMNESVTLDSTKREMKQALEVALLCTRSRSPDRPTMADALKLLSASIPHSK
ncbi:Leucine-rich repeat receptor-like protein kinase TDR [Linum grandiflorum]